MRLTPVKFKQLRQIDCIHIIQSYFGKDYDTQLNNIIKDHVITPTKLITLCQTYDGIYSIQDFFNEILAKEFEEIVKPSHKCNNINTPLLC
jgi:hypothetical protein